MKRAILFCSLLVPLVAQTCLAQPAVKQAWIHVTNNTDSLTVEVFAASTVQSVTSGTGTKIDPHTSANLPMKVEDNGGVTRIIMVGTVWAGTGRGEPGAVFDLKPGQHKLVNFKCDCTNNPCCHFEYMPDDFLPKLLGDELYETWRQKVEATPKPCQGKPTTSLSPRK